MFEYYQIAGLTVAMKSFGKTVAQAKPYLCPKKEPADITIDVDYRVLQALHPDASPDDCEYQCTGISFYRQLLDFGGIMLHSSGVVVDGKAYLFTADPGTGKSTHTGLYLQEFGDRAYILNDDKPALRLEDGGWFAYGTPWSGKHDISVSARVPVAGIAVLEQAADNAIAPLEGIDAIHAILKQVNRPKAAQYRVKLLELLDQLITQVPIWRLQCNMDRSAARLSYRVMSDRKGETV